MPDNVPLQAAAYTTLGAIALQGVRQADVSLGDRVAVVGLGLLGQLTVQILKAAGCKVLAVDLAPDMVELAKRGGADLALTRDQDIERAAEVFSDGWGVDRVILTASTRSTDPIELGGAISREKGIVVVVGNVNMDVPREVYYRKELDLRLSRSYGPGRYDRRYEERGIDYPLPYVRWTEGRNLSAFLGLIGDGSLDLDLLTTHRFAFHEADQAYRLVTGENEERSVGILLRYQAAQETPAEIVRRAAEPLKSAPTRDVGVSFVGAGSFAQNFLLPKLQGAAMRTVVTSTGLAAKSVAEKFAFERADTDPAAVFSDEGTQAVFIATRHDSHADLAMQALRAGKYVFVEKPLALTPEELNDVEHAVNEIGSGRLMVGFNRRFAPAARAVRETLKTRTGPVSLHYRVNAGALPREHWLYDPVVGGGRILGEACHFVDFALFLVEERITRVFASALPGPQQENVAMTLEFADGSMATIHYLANGDRSLAKEWIEIFSDGRAIQIDDFATATQFAHQRRARIRVDGKGRGYNEEIAAFLKAVRDGGAVPVPESDSIHVMRACFAALESLRTGEPHGVE